MLLKKIKTTHKIFPLYKGEKIKDTYGNKPVLDYHGEPLFAELYALREFMAAGYEGVWVDTFRRTFRRNLPEKKEPKIQLPDFVQKQLDKINPNGKLGGTWDLIIWKDKKIQFIELKREGKDAIRQTQIDFFKRALECGVSLECFQIYEWSYLK